MELLKIAVDAERQSETVEFGEEQSDWNDVAVVGDGLSEFYIIHTDQALDPTASRGYNYG